MGAICAYVFVSRLGVCICAGVLFCVFGHTSMSLWKCIIITIIIIIIIIIMIVFLERLSTRTMLSYAEQIQIKNIKHMHKHPKQHMCPDNHAQTFNYAVKRGRTTPSRPPPPPKKKKKTTKKTTTTTQKSTK